jgi:23S rRNA pseudouridine1911/1915/1917 synthase
MTRAAIDSIEVTPAQPEGPRSADALRFDPPLEKARFVLARTLGWPAFAEAVSEVLGDLGTGFERARWHGGVHVDGRPIDPDQPPETVAEGSRVAVYAFVREPEPIPDFSPEVLAEAEGWLAINKPAWFPMQRTRASLRVSLEAALGKALGEASLIAVHRLDRTTSGVALFARNRESASWIQSRLGERSVEKTYRAFVAPRPAEDEFEVSGMLGRISHPRRFVFGMLGEDAPAEHRARPSQSHFRILEQRNLGTLVEAKPVTGRTHQLRVHLAHVGSPIRGDEVYGRPWCEGDPGRALLHASDIKFPLPDGKVCEVHAEDPADFDS